MYKKKHLPRIPHAFFKWYCKENKYEELHGDLEELYNDRVRNGSRLKANLMYFYETLLCFQPYAIKKNHGQTNSSIGMLKNFYFTAIRNLVKRKSYFLINILGLSIGIASFILISLYVINEMSYDRFHQNHENTYRINSKSASKAYTRDRATVPPPMAKVLLDNYPEVEKVTRLTRGEEGFIELGDKKFNEGGILFVDSSFLQVFDFKLLKGDPKMALVNPRSIVLSESYARKYFGDANPMGREITVEKDTAFYIVTGISEDVPANSHLQFNILASLSTHDKWSTNEWITEGLHTYIIMKENTSIKALQAKLDEIAYKHLFPEIESYSGLTMAEWQEAGNNAGYYPISLKDIHLRSSSTDELEVKGNISYMYVYALIGIIILFMAIFNFVNMAIAQSSSRAREVGVRKVMGSTKKSLVFQYVLESIIVSFASTLLAIIIVLFVMPYFTALVGKNLEFGLTSSYIGIVLVFCLATFTGILAGFYPALVLSAFQPVDVLKGTFSKGGKSGLLQNFLVTIQFAASIFIIIGTIIIHGQIEFMLNKNLGFDKDQVLIIKRPDGLNRNLEVFKNDLLKNPNVRSVVNSQAIPGKHYGIRSYRKKDDPSAYVFKNNQIGFDYGELMNLELVSGRFFSKEYRSDSNALIINEEAASVLGFEDAVGQTLFSPWRREGEFMKIIGVVKNFNFESLHKNIEPISLELAPNNMRGYISVKMSNGQSVNEVVNYVENTWSKYSPNQPFQYFFFDEEYETLYKSEFRTKQVFIVFAALSIFIACLGLIGLIAYMTSIRKKEIGIRKVLGASTHTLVNLLSNQILRLIMIGTIVSWPIAYLASDYWLRNFADRLTVTPWLYLIPTFFVILIISLAVSFQTIKASRSNPIDSLRQE